MRDLVAVGWVALERALREYSWFLSNFFPLRNMYTWWIKSYFGDFFLFERHSSEANLRSHQDGDVI